EELSLAHNGDLINHQILRTRLEEEGMMFQTSIDSEVILFLIARYYNGDIVEAIKKTMSLIKGAYSVVLLLEDKLIAYRDNYGIRPIVMGETDEGDIIYSSENAPIEIMRAKVKRDILPGEIVVVDESGINSYFYENTQKPKHCIFEYVY